MSDSISTLLTRNLDDVFGENDPARRRAAIDEIFTEDCVFYEPRGVYHAATRSIASPARSGRLTRTFDINQLPLPRNWATVGGSDGSPALRVGQRCTLALTSSLLGTVRLPPFISFSTNYREPSTRHGHERVQVGFSSATSERARQIPLQQSPGDRG